MRTFAIVLLALAVSGCGTIINGSTQQVSFASTPSGASVTVDGLDMGETPVILPLSRKSTHTVVFDLDGYESESMIINRTVSGWAWGNLVFGGLVGLVIDLSTGGMYKLSPEQVAARLDAEGAASLSADGLYIAVVLEPSEDWEKVGQITPQP